MKKITEGQKVVTSNKVREIMCDQCSKIICDADYPKNKEVVFYSVHTYHHDWGNDSVDSHEYLDICSQKCLLDNMGVYYAEANGSESYDIEREEGYTKFFIDE